MERADGMGSAAPPGGQGGRRPGADATAAAFLASRRLDELPEEVFLLGAVWSACERCVSERDAAAASRLYPLLAGFAGCAGERAGGGFWSYTAARHLGALAGLLARWDDAADHLEDALRAAARVGAVVEVRRTQLAYARLLLGRGAPGDEVRAERLLAEIAGREETAQHGAEGAAAAGRTRSEAVCEPPASAAAGVLPWRASRYVFRREGDFWTLASDGSPLRIRHLRGLAYIAELLRRPYAQLYVVELAALAEPAERRLSAEAAVECGLRVSGEAEEEPALDCTARAAYRARWRELVAEQEEAERDHDGGRAARVQREIGMLAAQLTRAAKGGAGAGPSMKERARVNVRNCVVAALRAIRPYDATLWRHLANSLKTGAFCSYEPDRAVEWEM